jgi:membrane protease YdiL (CAAX protease family)
MEQNVPSALGLMFSPAIAALLTQFMYRKNLRGFGWKWGQPRYQILAYAVPMMYVLLTYTLIVLLGLGKLNPELSGEIAITDILLSATLGVLVNCIVVVGEEIGWRGFLLPKLAQIMSFTKASIIVGLIWILSHMPILVLADNHTNSTPVWYGLICFSVAAMGVNIAINWLRLKSGSVWTAVLFHAVHNQYVQELDPMISSTGLTQYFTTEFGLMLALAGVFVGWVFWRRRHELFTTSSFTAS